jgi:hypothetical protein
LNEIIEFHGEFHNALVDGRAEARHVPELQMALNACCISSSASSSIVWLPVLFGTSTLAVFIFSIMISSLDIFSQILRFVTLSQYTLNPAEGPSNLLVPAYHPS